MEEIPKPAELLAARTSAATLFALLQRWFEVPTSVTIDLRAVDSAAGELEDPQVVMGLALRKLQTFHMLCTPGVRTSTDVVLTVIQDLERALRQAPSMFLRRSARSLDWDAAFLTLEAEGTDAGAGDDEIALFRRHHAALHDAAKAVLHASHGRVCALI